MSSGPLRTQGPCGQGSRRKLGWALSSACLGVVACQFPSYGFEDALTAGGLPDAGGNASSGAPSGGDAGAGTAGGSGAASAVAGAASGEGGAAGDSDVLFEDDFESGNATRWLVIAGNPWSVVLDAPPHDHVYQLAPTFEAFYAAIAKQGPWADQVIEAKLRVADFGGDSTGDVAQIFGRFQDIDNYYAASIRSDGRASIRGRFAASGPSSLKTSAIIAQTGVWYTIRFSLIGDTLSLFVDGKLQVEVQDNRVSQGTVALGGNSSSAAFDDVSVRKP